MGYTFYLRAGFNNTNNLAENIRLDAWISDGSGNQFGNKITEIVNPIKTYLQIDDFGMAGKKVTAGLQSYSDYVMFFDYLLDTDTKKIEFYNNINNYLLNITLVDKQYQNFKAERKNIVLTKIDGLTVAGYSIQPVGQIPTNATSFTPAIPSPFVLQEVVDQTVPGAITNFVAQPQDRSVTLTWANPTDKTFKGVWLLRKLATKGIIVDENDPNADSRLLPVNTNTPTQLVTYTDSNLTNELDYYYRIFSYSASGIYNRITPQITCKPLDRYVDQVTNFVTVVDDQKLNLKWDAATSIEVQGYIIFRKKGAYPDVIPSRGVKYSVNYILGIILGNGDGSGSNQSSIGTDGSTKTFVDIGLENGSIYYYSIYAYDQYFNYYNHKDNQYSDGTRTYGTPAGAPRVAKAVSTSKTTLYVIFDQDMEQDQILNINNYLFYEGINSSSLKAISAKEVARPALHPSNAPYVSGQDRSVELTTTEQTSGALYTVKILPANIILPSVSTSPYKAYCCAFYMNGVNYISATDAYPGKTNCSLWMTQFTPLNITRIAVPNDSMNPEPQSLQSGFDGTQNICALLVGSRTLGALYANTYLVPQNILNDVIIAILNAHNSRDAVDGIIENLFVANSGAYTYDVSSLASAYRIQGTLTGSSYTGCVRLGLCSPLPELWGQDGVNGLRQS